jgi:hypothetical protein
MKVIILKEHLKMDYLMEKVIKNLSIINFKEILTKV